MTVPVVRLARATSVALALGMFATVLAPPATAQETRSASAQREVVIKVDGMFCPFCTFGVEKRLKQLPETQAVRTDLAAGEAVVTLKPGTAFVEARFADAIRRAGFTHSEITLRTVDGAQPAPEVPAVGPAPTRAVAETPGAAGFRVTAILGGPGSEPGRFDQPMTVAFSKDGWFVVADSGNGRVQQFRADGSFWREWTVDGVDGAGAAPLSKPVGVAVGPNGDIWVADYNLDTVSRYGPDGAPGGLFGESGGGPGQFDAPSGVAVLPNGRLAVADFYNHRVQLFEPDGAFVRTLGAEGLARRIAPSGLNYPTRVTAASDGNIWVADAYNHRVVLFDETGEVLLQFGEQGHGKGQFDVSSGLALLPDDRVAVADFMNHRVQIWSRDGAFLADFGAQGAAPGQFERPTDVALSPDGRLYVVDWGNHRLQIFERSAAP